MREWEISHSRTLPSTDSLLAIAIAALAFALYLRTLAPGLLGGDSGEFQFAAWLGGFAHPTGYPLYLLLGHLWTHLLPLHDPAWRMNAFSAFWGGVTVGLVYLLARRVNLAPPRTEFAASAPQTQHHSAEGGRGVRSCLLALGAAATFAVTPTFWSQAVVAEVYTLQTAFIAAILLCLVAWADHASEVRSLRWGYGAALLFGLSLTHHRTTLLWLPAIALFVWLTLRQRSTHRSLTLSPRHLVTVALLIALPQLLYLYLPLVASHAPYREVALGPDQRLVLYAPGVSGFLEQVSGSAFGSVFRTPADALSQFVRALRRFPAEITWGGVALGLLGLVWLARRHRPLLALTGGAFVTLFVFNLFYGIGDIVVYYIPLYLLWCLWIACGAAAIVSLLFHASALPSAFRRAQGKVMFSGLLVCPLALFLLLTNLPRIDQSANREARAFWATLLAEPIPPNAILVTNDRDEMMPQWYLRYVEGVRPDITGLFPLIQSGPAWADVGMTTATALGAGQPVFLIKPMPGLEVKLRLEPSGALTRVVAITEDTAPRSGAPERATDVGFEDPGAGAVRLIGYDAAPPIITPGAALTIRLHWQAQRRLAEDYTTFVHLLNAEGRVIGASDHRPGGVYYPTSLWKPGETLLDAHVFTLAGDVGQPPYWIEVGLYTGTQTLRHLGQPQRIGPVISLR